MPYPEKFEDFIESLGSKKNITEFEQKVLKLVNEYLCSQGCTFVEIVGSLEMIKLDVHATFLETPEDELEEPL